MIVEVDVEVKYDSTRDSKRSLQRPSSNREERYTSYDETLRGSHQMVMRFIRSHQMVMVSSDGDALHQVSSDGDGLIRW